MTALESGTVAVFDKLMGEHGRKWYKVPICHEYVKTMAHVFKISSIKDTGLFYHYSETVLCLSLGKTVNSLTQCNTHARLWSRTRNGVSQLPKRMTKFFLECEEQRLLELQAGKIGF